MNATVVFCRPFVDMLKVEGLTEAENIDPSALYNNVRMHIHVCTNFFYYMYPVMYPELWRHPGHLYTKLV